MKRRFLGATIALLVCVPPLLLGGFLLKIFVSIIALGSCYEFISIRKKRFNIPLYLSMIFYAIALHILPIRGMGLTLIFLISLFLMGILFYDISLDDISSTLLMGIIVAYAVYYVLKIYQQYNYLLMIFVSIGAFATDSGAYFVGYFLGKHPLIVRVSPKKTIEGALGGLVIGFALSFIFGYFFITYLPFKVLLFYALSLPVIAQVGDLSFSLIKRNYAVKDYGSIIPGHGGILDRIDSLLFCLIYFGSTGVLFGL